VVLPRTPGLRSDLECTVCGKPATMSCGGCAGFYYCDRAHQEMHWSNFDHHESCERTKKQVARTQELREDIFSAFDWGRLSTEMIDENVHTRCTLLEKLGVHNQNEYRRECPCHAKTPFGKLPPGNTYLPGGIRCKTTPVKSWCLRLKFANWQSHELQQWLRERVPNSTDACVRELRKPLSENWDVMMSCRLRALVEEQDGPLKIPEFAPKYPTPITLHTAATIDYAVRQLADFRGRPSDGSPERCVAVDVLGAEKEVDQLERTIIALHWLRYIDELIAPKKRGFVYPPLHLNLIGPEVPFNALYDRDFEGECWARTNPVTVHMYRGLYHEVRETITCAYERNDFLRDPHRLVFMPNAGIAAFTSWEPTLKMLVNDVGETRRFGSKQPVVVITDYTEEAANMGLKELKKMVLREKVAARWKFLEVRVNPYRQPVSCKGADNAMPSYANGFIFGMIPSDFTCEDGDEK